jgi:hypothetical protein
MDDTTLTLIGIAVSLVIQIGMMIERCAKRINSSSCRQVKANGDVIEMRVESNDKA